jgi:hypothetical protein
MKKRKEERKGRRRGKGEKRRQREGEGKEGEKEGRRKERKMIKKFQVLLANQDPSVAYNLALSLGSILHVCHFYHLLSLSLLPLGPLPVPSPLPSLCPQTHHLPILLQTQSPNNKQIKEAIQLLSKINDPLVQQVVNALKQ